MFSCKWMVSYFRMQVRSCWWWLYAIWSTFVLIVVKENRKRKDKHNTSLIVVAVVSSQCTVVLVSINSKVHTGIYWMVLEEWMLGINVRCCICKLMYVSIYNEVKIWIYILILELSKLEFGSETERKVRIILTLKIFCSL